MESEKDRKIRERAYELWVQGGRSEDSSEQDWFRAEQEFAAGSESPMAETSAPAGAATAASAKRTTRARSATSSETAPKPAAAAKRAPAKSGTKGEASKAASNKR